MCKDCGCGTADHDDHPHTHADGTTHTHSHDDDTPHDHDHPPTRTLEVEQRILARNDAAAEHNRAWLAKRGCIAVNLISSPGSGKTLLLERTLERLRDRVTCAVIAGDQQTDNDARRLEGKGAVVRQIETHSACHLEAARVARELPLVTKEDARLIFIENVGNLVCPAAFDLGEHFKIALLSCTEGEDKPAKYPTLFASAPVAVLTKMDLAPHLDWDAAKCRTYLNQVHPGVFIFELSAKTGDGMDAWIDYLLRLVPGAE